MNITKKTTQGKCPYCSALNYRRMTRRFVDDILLISCKCDNCNKEFEENFELSSQIFNENKVESSMTLEDFKRDFLNKSYPHEWDFDLFKVKCNKCSSENVEINGIAESEGGYYGDHSLKLRVWCKCHNCGNFMGINGDDRDKDEPFINSKVEK